MANIFAQALIAQKSTNHSEEKEAFVDISYRTYMSDGLIFVYVLRATSLRSQATHHMDILLSGDPFCGIRSELQTLIKSFGGSVVNVDQ